MSAAVMPEGFDAQMWETMTEEERAGIVDPGYEVEDVGALKKIAGDGKNDADDADEDDEPGAASGDNKDDAKTGGDDAAAAAAETKTETPAAAVTDEIPEELKAAPAAAPVFKAELPADYDEKVQANQAAEADAWTKFENGDLTRTELQAELSRINTERQSLHDLKLKADISESMGAQTTEQQWQSAVDRAARHYAKAEQGGVDYAKDDAKRADWDQFVKVLASNPANENKPMEWFLHEAHKRVLALHGLARSEPVKRETPADANARRKPNLPSTPPNLAHVPGGDGPGDVGSEFADIDSLEGEDLEAAIASMSPAQRARYAAGR